MIQNVIRNLGGSETFGIISVCLFFLVFSGALIWALGLKKAFLETMESLPLRDENPAPIEKGEKRHE
ncbi:MAG: hypothetical protein ACYDH9_12040 [Limisphaerales bacterium]